TPTSRPPSAVWGSGSRMTFSSPRRVATFSRHRSRRPRRRSRRPARPDPRSRIPGNPMRIHYDVRWDKPASHLFAVTMRVDGVPADPLEVAMPAWIPGAYEVLDAAKHVSRFEARGARGRLRFRKTDKQTWRIACPGERAVEIRYRCYGNTVACIASSLD